MFNDNGSFLLALFEFFLFFAWFMCLFWIFGDIFRSKDLGGGAKTFWVLFVIFVPWLGILVYLIARGKGMHERQLEQAQAFTGPRPSTSSRWPPAPPRGSGPDCVGEGPAGQRHDHPGGVRSTEGKSPRRLIFGDPRVPSDDGGALACLDSPDMPGDS